ncbi:tenascin isoform X1 [Labrus mixtus]|uniref:tenascin isoform X1 n=1 Tax=Labrus mixtus TaxID=508554 RepID=UPI0029C00A91|nr:tenascin isoform X1 [Labrus mixtus]
MSPSLLLVLLLAAPALLTPLTSQELEVRGQRPPRDTKQDSIKVVISEGCSTQGDSADVSQGGREIDLTPGSPLVLTHKIKLVTSGSGSGSGSCGCEMDFAALRERLERLEREVSSLREKCGGAEGGCCTSKESKGAGCSIKPDTSECPNECNDQGRCVDGKCVCFPGFSGPDCGQSNCPGNCDNKGKCVNGQCVCDPGFSGPDCSQGGCPDNCNNRGRCVNGQCVCDSGFTGPSCSDKSCPGNCNNRGRCINGQCACNPGFAPPDCAKRGCPDNCNNQGRCVNGKCVCDNGFTGADCSETGCPGNCNNRGRCVDGECVCNEGFGGPDCLEIICPNDCYDRGRCVNGQCVCDIGFTGEDCSQTSCPGNCNNKGRCVNGQCVCDRGFTGEDCSETSCPGNCNNKGRCVNGQCVCDGGFTGEDCSQTSCPGNCNNKGRCVNGQCVCDRGFTGEDCSETSCPGNCNNKGRCVNGQCVCDGGFTGEDCSQTSCPGNCNNKGRCVNGQCVCDGGFTGEDCSETSCPGNCNNKGRCVNGQCVCDGGFTGEDCSDKACPNNCSNRGKCVNGKCVCDVGFAGPDCAAKGCPNNCRNKGRCVKGRCVCRRGFTGPDCSQCEEGMTGPNCDTVMSGVSQLSTRDVTESSVTLVWNPPPIQYETYYITFTSQKESDQQIKVQVDGSVNTFTQTGLAAGQEYTVSITGEIDGRRGAESSAEFMTLISGPSNLHVVKTTTTSAVLQWEQSHGELDRYRLTITPNDGAGSSKELTFPPGQDSAHIQELEAGRLYDVTLVAEKGASQSGPAFTQVTPGQTLPWAPSALTLQVTKAPRQDVGDKDQEFYPSAEKQNFDNQNRGEDKSDKDAVTVRGTDASNRDSTTSLIARTKPLPSKKMPTDGSRPKLAKRPTLSKKPNVTRTFRFNTTRVVHGGRKVDPGPLKITRIGEKNNPPIFAKNSQPLVPTTHDGTTALNLRDQGAKRQNTDRTDAKNPALISGIDLDTKRQSSLQGPTFAVGSREQPDVGKEGRGNENASMSSEPTGTVQSQEKKCMNKIKVTHFRLPIKGRGSGCKEAGQVLAGKTPGLQQGSTETDDSPDLDYSPDPLHKLLTDTFDSLNITTFSVHLSKPSDISVDAETVRGQIVGGLKPLSSYRSSSSSLTSSQSSSQSSSPSPPLASSSSTVEPLSSVTHLNSSPSSSQSSLPLSSQSTSHSSTENSDSSGSKERGIENSRSTINIASSEDRRLPTKGNVSLPFFRRTPTKPAYDRRQNPNIGKLKNLKLRVPQHPPSHLNLVPRTESETTHRSPSELLSTASPSASEESPSVEVNVPVSHTIRNKDGTTTPTSSGDQKNEKKVPTARGKIPFRRVPPKGGYPHRQFTNFGHLQNQTRPNLRQLPPPSRPLNPASETRVKLLSSTETPATSPSPVSKESYPAKGTGPKGEQSNDSVGTNMFTTRMTNEFNQTLRESGGSSSHHPTKVGQVPRPTFGHRFQNKTHTNLRQPQHPYRGPLRRPLPTRRINSGSSIAAESQTHLLEKKNIHKIPENKPGGQNTSIPAQGVQNGQVGEQGSTVVISSAHINKLDTTEKAETNILEGRPNAQIQTIKQRVEELSTQEPNTDTLKEAVNGGKNTGFISQGSPTIKNIGSTDLGHRAQRPVTVPKRGPPTRGLTTQNQGHNRQYYSGGKRRESTKTYNTSRSELPIKTKKMGRTDSKTLTGSNVSSTGVTREPLDHVGVTNQTSDGFMLVWDSPEGKYKNFVVTQNKNEKGPKQKDTKKDQEEEQEDAEKEDGDQTTEEKESETGKNEDENKVPESVFTEFPTIQSSITAKPVTGSDKTFKQVLPGSARSFQFENLPPQTDYTITLLGKGPGILSRLHKLVISTGPEPPTDIVFSELTDNSLTVSWTKPKSSISGFKVTYTHKEEGEPVSVSVDSGDSTLGLSQLSPGSTYEVSIISVLGLDESDPLKDFVTTLPDPPTDLRAVNVTDTNALLLWRPALAAVDKYAIVYGSGTDSELRISVSGNAAEHRLSGLEASTTYTVTITSQLGSKESTEATTSFTTTGGSGGHGDNPRDLQASNVTPRTALLSWKPPSKPVGSYRLTYQTEDQEMKELIVDAAVTQFNLTRLHPGSKYKVQLQAAEGGHYSAAIFTEFTTGTLRFPFPTDCSQELLNGIKTSGEVEIFPQGKLGTSMMVYCDMETDGGGWIVFQRRKDGSVDFFRGWKDYQKGFGDLSGEFWLGLDSLHNLTSFTKMNLRVDLRDKDESVFAKYSTFEVARRNYKLTVGGYSGTAGDSLTYHNTRLFSTKDRDPTPFITRCAMSYRGGWWYKNCHEANLNGLYGIDVKHQGIIWTSWKGKEHSISFTEMKMRPSAFRG